MIVIPMAGMSRRFALAGYNLPKYMLPLHGKSVFSYAVESFSNFFNALPFVFIARRVQDTEAFLRAECGRLGIADARFVFLDSETSGQAETVALGIESGGIELSDPITIFNVDTFRSDFKFPSGSWISGSDGYLEVFVGEGPNWSYVLPDADKQDSEPLVVRTAEKEPISNLCCNGLYHFSRALDFLHALECERRNQSYAELYVAPIYNHLISRGYCIHYELIERNQITFCGIPEEYESLVRRG